MDTIDFCCRSWPYRNSWSFIITTKYWYQLQKYFKSKTFILFKSNIFDDISISNHFWNWNQSFNYTALAYAAHHGHTEIVDHLLLQPNIDINIKGILNQKHSWYSNLISISNHFWNWNQSFNWTPLICSAANGHTEIVNYLLSQPNIDINCKNILIQKHSFYSNLIFLMKFQFLIIFGIWKEIIYKTAIDYAKERNRPEIVELLSKGPK